MIVSERMKIQGRKVQLTSNVVYHSLFEIYLFVCLFVSFVDITKYIMGFFHLFQIVRTLAKRGRDGMREGKGWEEGPSVA